MTASCEELTADVELSEGFHEAQGGPEKGSNRSAPIGLQISVLAGSSALDVELFAAFRSSFQVARKESSRLQSFDIAADRCTAATASSPSPEGAPKM